MGTVLHDRAIVIQSVIALKAENWPGQEGGMKVSGLERGGESVRTGRG
ncbi:unnamed protein product [Staurois parvus]|uniref:Uncharacterized protein n=1 Tax=Staurois parvus TaxID=386267 RepID=A0ABN9D4U4_9NEOB|nr:unnamed protein product [Staurois parvus]